MAKNFRTAVTALLILGFVVLTGCARKDESKGVMPKMLPDVVTLTIGEEKVEITSLLPGRVTPRLVAEVRPQVTGIIKKRYFTEGGDVKAGELLYQIEPATYEAALANAKASLARAEANLPAVKKKLERYKELLPVNGVSQQDYDDVSAQLKQIEAEILYWQASVKNAEINLGYTKVVAPISGKISKSNVTEGALVTANQPVPLTTIQQLNPIYVDVTQSTTDLLKLKKVLESGLLKKDAKKETEVTLILEDGTKYPWKGWLQFKDITVDQSTGSVSLRILFENPDHVLLPGMFVRAQVFQATNKNAILIPQEAVLRDPKGNPFVFVVKEGNVIKQTPLVIDRAIGNRWLISSGVKAGERIVIEGIQKIRDGDVVNVVNK